MHTFFSSSTSLLIQEYSFLGSRAQDTFWCVGCWLRSSYSPTYDLLSSMSETGEARFLLILNTRGTLAQRLISQLVSFMDKAAEIMATRLGMSQGVLEGVTVSWLAVCFSGHSRWQPARALSFCWELLLAPPCKGQVHVQCCTGNSWSLFQQAAELASPPPTDLCTASFLNRWNPLY